MELVMEKLKSLLPYILIIVGVILLRTFIITPIVVQGDSMVPTLKGNELMILKKYDKKYKRFDIVVVNKEIHGDNLIKRVIGLPGETIEYRHGKLYINDKKIDDPYGCGETRNFAKVTLGDDEYFLMGDNREISLDSRGLGAIPEKDIEGTVGIILYPFNKIGKVKDAVCLKD